MRKHILSKFAEKRMVGKMQMHFSGGTYHTDGLENSDIDVFNRSEQQICGGTTITETIEPSDVEMLNDGGDWTKASETLESSDVDAFFVNRICDCSKATYSIEPSDTDAFSGNRVDSTKVTAHLESSDDDFVC